MDQILSPGKIEGILYFIDSYNQLKNIDLSDKVIVIKKLDEKSLLYIYGVKGVIVEEGSFLSHVAIFLRESKIPCRIISNMVEKYNNLDKISLD